MICTHIQSEHIGHHSICTCPQYTKTLIHCHKARFAGAHSRSQCRQHKNVYNLHSYNCWHKRSPRHCPLFTSVTRDIEFPCSSLLVQLHMNCQFDQPADNPCLLPSCSQFAADIDVQATRFDADARSMTSPVALLIIVFGCQAKPHADISQDCPVMYYEASYSMVRLIAQGEADQY